MFNCLSSEQVMAQTLKLDPRKGIEFIYSENNNNFTIYSSKGIGSFLLHLPKGEIATVNFYYKSSSPFKSFEGINFTNISNGIDKTKELESSGRVFIHGETVKIKAPDASISLQIEFVDYYRN